VFECLRGEGSTFIKRKHRVERMNRALRWENFEELANLIEGGF